MNNFALDYFLFAFMVSFGVLQLAATWGRLYGLSFFRKRLSGYIFAAIMVGVACWWFYRVDRNIPDIGGGLSGPSLFGLLILAIIATLVLTIVIASILKARWGSSDPGRVEGFEALKRTTYLKAIARRFRGEGRD